MDTQAHHPESTVELFHSIIDLPEPVAADLLLLCWGAYAPLTTFMNRDDYQSVLERGRLAGGDPFPLPIVLPIPESTARSLSPSDVVHLKSVDGLRARMVVRETFPRLHEFEALQIYHTQDEHHPGVAELFNTPNWCLSGTIELLEEPRQLFTEPSKPSLVRAIIAQREWKSVVFFQTRNPIHRAHEYLHKVALEICDGLVLHPLVGWTKSDDIPAPIRMASYRVLLEHYYPKERTALAVFPAAMRYAGPREALFHALVRKNYGATHFVVGRDAAGVGDFYGPDEARELVEAWADEIGIIPLTFEAAAYCPHCRQVASGRTCPHSQHWFSLSGTEVRRRLSHGEALPSEFMRPEVSDVLTRALTNLSEDVLSVPREKSS